MTNDQDLGKKSTQAVRGQSHANSTSRLIGNANLIKFKKVVINKIIPKSKNVQEILDKVIEQQSNKKQKVTNLQPYDMTKK